MHWGAALLWGVFGGFAVEGLDLYRAIRRYLRLPWGGEGRPSWSVYLVAVLLRLGIGAGLAVGLSNAGHVRTALEALTIGITAPMIVERLGATPGPGPGEPASAPAAGAGPSRRDDDPEDPGDGTTIVLPDPATTPVVENG